jgi:hypothetical protein
MKVINYSFTLIMIFVTIEYCLAQETTCGSFIPQDTNSCFMYTSNTTYCCSLSTFSNKFHSNICYPIVKTEYLGLKNQISLGGYNYDINCGTSIGTTCGNIPVPKSHKDCSQFSLYYNSCCYYKYNGDTSCVWLGTGDTGKVESDGLTLICNSSYLRLSFNLFYFVLIFLLG